MNTLNIRIITLLGALSLAGIVFTQIYWIHRAYTIEQDRQDARISSALNAVARRMLGKKFSDSRLLQPVHQIRPEFFVVRVDDVIDANLLEHYLREELSTRGFTSDFEYSIYDCESQKLVYGNYVKLASSDEKTKAEVVRWPNWDKESYYFGVYFPNKQSYILQNLQIWIFSSIAILFIVIFFTYSIWVIFRQKRLSEVQRDFINTMTHEFKTPLTTISLSAEAIQMPNFSKNPEKVYSYASLIRNEVSRIRDLVEQVLQVAQVDKTGLKLNKKVVNVTDVTRKLVSNFTSASEHAKCHVHLMAEGDIEVCLDRTHYVNLVSNLIDNSLKYAGEGSHIHVKLSRFKNSFRLVVSDNGRGIPEEYHRNIFKKFTRGPAGDGVKGFGLGLYYVWVVVKVHGGRIRLKSGAGNGTTFFILFPLGLKPLTLAERFLNFFRQ